MIDGPCRHRHRRSQLARHDTLSAAIDASEHFFATFAAKAAKHGHSPYPRDRTLRKS